MDIAESYNAQRFRRWLGNLTYHGYPALEIDNAELVFDSSKQPPDYLSGRRVTSETLK